MSKEDVEWLEWGDNSEEWGEVECPMFDNKNVMTYYNSELSSHFSCHYSYTAPFREKDGTIGYYQFDHDTGQWDEWMNVMEVISDE